MPAVYGFGKSGLGRELHLSRRHLRLLLAMPKNIKNNLGPTTYYDDTHTYILLCICTYIIYIYNYSLPLFSLSLSHCAKGQYLAAVHRSALRTRLIGIQKWSALEIGQPVRFCTDMCAGLKGLLYPGFDFRLLQRTKCQITLTSGYMETISYCSS